MHINRIPIPVTDFAERVGVSRTFLFDQAAKGRLALHRLGKRTVVQHEEALRFLSELPTARIHRHDGEDR